MSISSPHLRNTVMDITFLAFFKNKPLFTAAQKPKAAQIIEKSYPLINKGFVCFWRELFPDLRQHAQISRSGLQYLIEEFKDDDETFENLKPILDAPGVKCVEEEIKAHTGILPEYWNPPEMDLSKIPSSHFWWFFVEEDDDE